MKTYLIAGLAVLAIAFQARAQSRIVTIVQAAPNQTNTVHIADFEHVKVLSARDLCGWSTDIDRGRLSIDTQSAKISYFLANSFRQNITWPDPVGVTCAGPADVAVTSGSFPDRRPDSPVFVTLEVCPSAYPVTNTITLGPGQGAEINLESSTNLVQWTPTTNGVYTAESAMFFRTHLRRIQ